MMKDHRKVERSIGTSELTGTLETVVARIQRLGDGLLNPVMAHHGYESAEFIVTGWIPFTPEELQKQAERRERQRGAAKTRMFKRRTRDEQTFLRQAERFGYRVVKE